MKKVLLLIGVMVLVGCGSGKELPQPEPQRVLFKGPFNEITIDTLHLTSKRLKRSKVDSQNHFTLTRYESGNGGYNQDDGIHCFFRDEVTIPKYAKGRVSHVFYNNDRFAPTSVVVKYDLVQEQDSTSSQKSKEENSISLRYDLVFSKTYLKLSDLTEDEKKDLRYEMRGNIPTNKNGYVIFEKTHRKYTQTLYLIRISDDELRFVSPQVISDQGRYRLNILLAEEMPKDITEYRIDSNGYAVDSHGNYFVQEYDTKIISIISHSRIYLHELRYREFFKPTQVEIGEW